MADWFDIIGQNLPSLLKAGGGLYQMTQGNNRIADLARASQSPQVDPFGAGNRGVYQQKLAELYADPNFALQNLPGYKFAQEQGLKSINREAAKTGKYISTNRLYDVADYTTGLASQMYGSEADRLAKLSGAQFGPNAGAYKDLVQSGATAGQQNDANLKGVVGSLLDSPLAKQGGKYLLDKAKDLFGGDAAAPGSNFLPGGDAGVDSLYGDAPGPQAPGAPQANPTPGDSFQAPTGAIPLPTSQVAEAGNLAAGLPDAGGLQLPGGPGGGPGINQGLSELMGPPSSLGPAGAPGSELMGPPSNLANPVAPDASWGINPQAAGGQFAVDAAGAAGSAGAGAGGGAVNFLDNFGKGAGVGASKLFGPGAAGSSLDQLKGAYGAAKESAGGIGALAGIGGAGGGFLGGMLGKKLGAPGSAQSKLGGIGGSLAGTMGGATLGSLAAGSALGTVGGGVGGAAATGALGAGLASTGIGAILAAALQVGMGTYGAIQGSRARDKSRDSYRAAGGQALAGPQIADPTGNQLGTGNMYTSPAGYDFFMPAANYESLTAKNMSGEYLGNFDTAQVQGPYGWYNDPASGWTAGKFGGDTLGGDAFNAAAWTQLGEGGYQADQDKYRGTVDKYVADEATKTANPDWSYTPDMQTRGYSGAKESLSGDQQWKDPSGSWVDINDAPTNVQVEQRGWYASDGSDK